jgi:hypothetical protein
MKAYTNAITYFQDALNYKPKLQEDQEKEVKELLAVCYSNR